MVLHLTFFRKTFCQFHSNSVFTCFRAVVLSCMLPFLLAGCEEEKPPEKAEVIRHIKHMTLKLKPMNQARVIAGLVQPVVETNVAFEVAGQIRQLKVSVGDRVKKGDLIAE